MSKYKPEKFNFSGMSEKIAILAQNTDGSYSESLRCWAHLFKDGFTRSETDNFYKVMVREQKSLMPLLQRTNRIKWRGMLFSIFSWRDPSYEDRGFIELMIKQIPGAELDENGNIIGDDLLFKDIVSIYRPTKKSIMRYGIEEFTYNYDFSEPSFVGVKCSFSTDRNRHLEEKKFEYEKDSVIVRFNASTDVREEDYIESPFHGRYKVDMVAKNEENILEAYVQRREVQ